MRTYTVEVTWRISEYAHLIVNAETPEAAMAKAGAVANCVGIG